MRISFGTRLLASLALATLVTGTLPGAAHAALSPDQASCRKRVGKEGRSLLKKVQKALAKCRDKMSKGQLPLMHRLHHGAEHGEQDHEGDRQARRQSHRIVRGHRGCAAGLRRRLLRGVDGRRPGELPGRYPRPEGDGPDRDVVRHAAAVLSSTVQKCQSGASKESQKLLDKQHKLITTCKDKVAAGKLPPDHRLCRRDGRRSRDGPSKGATKIVEQVQRPNRRRPHVRRSRAPASPTRPRSPPALLGAYRTVTTRLITVEYGSGAERHLRGWRSRSPTRPTASRDR